MQNNNSSLLYAIPEHMFKNGQIDNLVFPFPNRMLSRKDAAELMNMSLDVFDAWAARYGVIPCRKTQNDTSRARSYALWDLQVAMIRYHQDEKKEFTA